MTKKATSFDKKLKAIERARARVSAREFVDAWMVQMKKFPGGAAPWLEGVWDFRRFRWASGNDLVMHERTVRSLLKEIAKKKLVHLDLCKGSKIASGELSQGCQLCIEGLWSCLYVNRECNASCFYCPNFRESKIFTPTAEGVEFQTSDEYLEFLERYKFRGVSFSGGEPFLKFELVCQWLAKLRAKFGKGLYIWIYTNGKLINQERLKKLRDLGLDEIRFDIGATDYSLDHLEKAIGIIRTVSIEIPAVPEEFARLKDVLVRANELGVDFVNLHQLVLSPYNVKEFGKRSYHLVPGAHIAVLESELTALKLIEFGIESGLKLPIHYCSTPFKTQFQAAGRFSRAATFAVHSSIETVTEKQMIRSFALTGSKKVLPQLISELSRSSKQGRPLDWWFDEEKGELLISERRLTKMDWKGARLHLRYFAPKFYKANESASQKKILLAEFRNLSPDEFNLFLEVYRNSRRGVDETLKQILQQAKKKSSLQKSLLLMKKIEAFESLVSGLRNR